MRDAPKPNETWIHCKGGEYVIVCIADHTEGDGDHVVYQSKANGAIWVRPLDMFLGQHETGPLRFTRKD